MGARQDKTREFAELLQPRGTSRRDTDTAAVKFASCEDSRARNEGPAVPPAEARPGASDGCSAADAVATSVAPAALDKSAPDKSASEKTALEVAIDDLTALGAQSDDMVQEKWSKRARPLLTKSLTFLGAYEAAGEAERKAVRLTLKAKSGTGREPNVDNLPLIAVYMGVSCSNKALNKKQRGKWGRFATVVKVAKKAGIRPDNAAKWLEKKTLNGLLAEWRGIQKAAGKAMRKKSVPRLKDYTHLAAALAKGSKFQDLAKEELAKADAAVEKAMSATKAATGVTAPAMAKVDA